MILHEGDSTYLELSSQGKRCPRCNALLSLEARRAFALDGLQTIERPRPGEKSARRWGLATEHTPERCQARHTEQIGGTP